MTLKPSSVLWLCGIFFLLACSTSRPKVDSDANQQIFGNWDLILSRSEEDISAKLILFDRGPGDQGNLLAGDLMVLLRQLDVEGNEVRAILDIPEYGISGEELVLTYNPEEDTLEGTWLDGQSIRGIRSGDN